MMRRNILQCYSVFERFDTVIHVKLSLGRHRRPDQVLSGILVSGHETRVSHARNVAFHSA